MCASDCQQFEERRATCNTRERNALQAIASTAQGRVHQAVRLIPVTDDDQARPASSKLVSAAHETLQSLAGNLANVDISFAIDSDAMRQIELAWLRSFASPLSQHFSRERHL
jgi:hypothetical protein